MCKKVKAFHGWTREESQDPKSADLKHPWPVEAPGDMAGWWGAHGHPVLCLVAIFATICATAQASRDAAKDRESFAQMLRIPAEQQALTSDPGSSPKEV